jgi:hypothetical protein
MNEYTEYDIVLETTAVVKKGFRVTLPSDVDVEEYALSPKCLGLRGDCHSLENRGWEVETVYDVNTDAQDVEIKISKRENI